MRKQSLSRALGAGAALLWRARSIGSRRSFRGFAAPEIGAARRVNLDASQAFIFGMRRHLPVLITAIALLGLLALAVTFFGASVAAH
jgi:hypothetical protein